MRTRTTTRRRGSTGAAAIAAFALLGTACAADGPDAHLAGDPAPEAAEATEESVEEHGDVSTEAEMTEDETTEAEMSDSGDSEAAAVETYPPNGEVVTVLALDNSFVDEVVEVEAGTEVLWTNNGRNDHDVIPVDPTQEWGIEIEDFPPTAEYSHVFTTPGEYPYFCTIHGTETVGMTGTIIVTG